jgi:hypothetical protein
MEEKKCCPICGLVITGDVIKHITSKEHEAALKVLLEKEAAQQSSSGRLNSAANLKRVAQTRRK